MTFEELIDHVELAHMLPRGATRTCRRHKTTFQARAVAMFLLQETGGFSSVEIGRIFKRPRRPGGPLMPMDHSSVLSAMRGIRERCAKDARFMRFVSELYAEVASPRRLGMAPCAPGPVLTLPVPRVAVCMERQVVAPEIAVA